MQARQSKRCVVLAVVMVVSGFNRDTDNTQASVLVLDFELHGCLLQDASFDADPELRARVKAAMTRIWREADSRSHSV